MTCRLDETSKNILEFRPNIAFVEPDQKPGIIEGLPDRLQFEDVQAGRSKIKKLAQAVNQLATAVQARVDQKAKGIVIKLDKNVDQDAIQAMRRRFPDADPTQITYEQYRECRNGIIGKGIDVADQGFVSPENIKGARDQLGGEGGNKFIPGGYGTDKSKDGGLRPELNARGQIIQPLNIEEVQIVLICILVNFIWKNFIKKTVINASPPVSWAFYALPDQICDPGASIDIPGLLILGEKPDDLLSGKAAAEATAEAGL